MGETCANDEDCGIDERCQAVNRDTRRCVSFPCLDDVQCTGSWRVSATRTQTAVFPTIVPVVTRTGIVSATNCANRNARRCEPKAEGTCFSDFDCEEGTRCDERASVFLKTSAGLPLIVLLESCVTGSSADQLVLEIAVGTTMAAAMVLFVSVESVEMKTMPGGVRVEVVGGGPGGGR